MRHRGLSIPLALLAAVVVSIAGVGRAAATTWLEPTDDRPAWKLAMDLAFKERKPVMAFVYVPESDLTAKMNSLTFADKAVTEAAAAFERVRIDALRPENAPFLDAFQLRGPAMGVMEEGKFQRQAFPVTVFISPDGQAEHIVYGFMIPDDFAVTLGQVQEVVQIREGLKKKPDDAKALGRLGGLYVTLQRYAAARPVLEQALKLDPDGKLAVAEAARLDLAVALLAAGECDRAVALVVEDLALSREGDLACKARFLLGAALLASAETNQQQADRLAAQGDHQGAAAARAEAQGGRRKAEEAWRWFEATTESRQGPCNQTEWPQYALGALEDVRTEVGFREAEAMALGGDPKAAADALRKFIATATEHLAELNKHRDPNTPLLPEPARIFDAWFLTGQELMESQTYGEAADHWRKFLDRYPLEPKGNPPVATQDRDTSCQAAFLLGECLLRLGKRDEALAQWKKTADPDGKKNPCAYTAAIAKAGGALAEEDLLATGRKLMDAKRYDDAAAHWRQFLDKYPYKPTGATKMVAPELDDSCEAGFLLGQCLLLTGKRQEALDLWTELSRPDPANLCQQAPAAKAAAAALQDAAKPR